MLPLRRASVSRASSPTSQPSYQSFFNRGRRSRAQLLRTLGLMVCLVIGWGAFGPLKTRHQLDQFNRQRKIKRDGNREAFMAREKWEHPGGILRRASWPRCERVMLFRMKGLWGFTSELGFLLRAAVMSNQLGYTLLIDDTEWNYGTWRSYFEPTELECVPPEDWAWTNAAVPLGHPRWESSDRVWFGRELGTAGDGWLRSQLDPASLATLRQREYGHILPARDTVPDELLPLFTEFAAAARELWRPNDGIQLMVREERLRLKLGRGRSNGRGTGRAPVIGAHVRLGDKEEEWKREMDEFGITNSYGNMTAYWEGAIEAVDHLHATTWANLEYTAPPTFLLMTAESSVLTGLASDKLSAAFAIETTATPAPQSLADWSQDLRGIGLSAQELKDAGRAAVLASYSQHAFNALPEKLRVHLTRFFVRDVEVLARLVDAAVVTGSSNVGRFICLLGGVEAVRGPVDPTTGESTGGRCRSIDGWWYPTGFARSLFDDEKDKLAAQS